MTIDLRTGAGLGKRCMRNHVRQALGPHCFANGYKPPNPVTVAWHLGGSSLMVAACEFKHRPTQVAVAVLILIGAPGAEEWRVCIY